MLSIQRGIQRTGYFLPLRMSSCFSCFLNLSSGIRQRDMCGKDEDEFKPVLHWILLSCVETNRDNLRIF